VLYTFKVKYILKSKVEKKKKKRERKKERKKKLYDRFRKFYINYRKIKPLFAFIYKNLTFYLVLQVFLVFHENKLQMNITMRTYMH
jgi:hypothetical protein